MGILRRWRWATVLGYAALIFTLLGLSYMAYRTLSAHADVAYVASQSIPFPVLPGDDPPSVLVVEDEDVIRELLRKVVEGLGCEAVEAVRGLDAVDWIEKGPVHLMFLDLHLPGGDGVWNS